jgi:hypothetical protein
LVFGIPFVKKYYSQCFSRRRVEKAISENIEKHKNEKDVIYEKVHVLRNEISKDAIHKRDEKTSKYWEAVFQLQDNEDFTFFMAWNNYNYYSDNDRRKSERKNHHYYLVENYIYNRVYEKNQEFEEKKDMKP